MKIKIASLLFVLLLSVSSHAAVLWLDDVIPDDPTLWTSATEAYVGKSSPTASLTVNGGSDIVSGLTNIARYYIANSVANVDGNGSTWTTADMYVGNNGYGVLNITNGGYVSSVNGDIGHVGSGSDRTSEVNVEGQGSTWTNSANLMVGYGGNSILNISNSGLVSVGGTLTIDYSHPGDNFVNMTSGGMLALYDSGWVSDNDLEDFLTLINGTGPIQYWDGNNWANITEATYVDDYILTHNNNGNLAGYTVLTVPEPAALLMFSIGGFVIRKRKVK